ncbi:MULTISPECIES: hypothetical protein [Micromonospora]|uniref:Septum formation initiator n=1 Tax=Micromonospora chalcea TaxID=1874 RepID=A0ABX9YAC1_MICCH|nr:MULTISPECIES: hypothetical protein [Micromonospora]EWM68517.1 hypothetical protein MCBG_05651 [Micromonospora sp. M42]MBC8994226.1 hypothetical protein [Micromonospora chalcea]MBP1784664.1 hypothetical protein [Micromonospora sp. HB375]MBQ1063758.1 hypothetical protein [Micromonospora sp. C41]MBQ1069065.1 hypothetical protein [Micromonospora sp. D75]
MNVEKRDGRGAVGQRAPRSGGRTAAQRTTRATTATDRREDTRARGAREFPTQGSAALRPAERTRVTGTPAPRLRVAPPAPIRVPRAPFVALILVLVVGGVLGILAVNTKINENAFKLERLQQQQAKLDVDEQELKKEIANQKAPGNLTANARKLGLVESEDPAYIRLPDGQTIGVPHPAQGAPSVTSQQGNGG